MKCNKNAHKNKVQLYNITVCERLGLRPLVNSKAQDSGVHDTSTPHTQDTYRR